jgi:hypothetical protein
VTSDPMVLFIDTVAGDSDHTSPQEILEIEWTGSDLSSVLQRLMEDD